MMSGVFRFVLPELSSHFVLYDHLCSFRLERPLPSSPVPPWDLLSVLRFLRGSSFEPLSSCSLQDLTWKVLFLVSLVTAQRVWKLQAVSSSFSFSGADLYLSYLLEFVLRPSHLSILFLGLSVSAPRRTLLAIFRRNSSISPCPRSLFVSPRSPFHSLSKNALSFFLHDLSLRLLPLLTLLLHLSLLLLPLQGLHVLLLLLLLLLLLPSGLIVFGGLQRQLLLRGMLHFLPFLRPPLGLPPLSLLPSTLKRSSSLLLLGLA